jgi:hypothetical protein
MTCTSIITTRSTTIIEARFSMPGRPPYNTSRLRINPTTMACRSTIPQPIRTPIQSLPTRHTWPGTTTTRAPRATWDIIHIPGRHTLAPDRLPTPWSRRPSIPL